MSLQKILYLPPIYMSTRFLQALLPAGWPGMLYLWFGDSFRRVKLHGKESRQEKVKFCTGPFGPPVKSPACLAG
jgi:hypothetical protein